MWAQGHLKKVAWCVLKFFDGVGFLLLSWERGTLATTPSDARSHLGSRTKSDTPFLTSDWPRPTTADISLVHLAALKASTRDEEITWGNYAENGASIKRIKAVLKSQENCGCTCSRERLAQFAAT